MSLMSLLYFVDCLVTLQRTVGVTIGGFLGFLSAYFIWWSILTWNTYERNQYTHESERKKYTPFMGKFPKISAYILAFLLILNIFLPGQKTLYLMAAAKFSEKIIDGPIPQKAIKILELKLDEIIKDKQNDK